MSTEPHIPAQVFPLGHHLREELAYRHVTPKQLCRDDVALENTLETVLRNDKTRLTFREAEKLADCLGVGAAFLLNLQLLWFKYKPAE